jgi:AraC-like DNA-binding protein
MISNQQLEPRQVIPSHQHETAYAAVILAGRYREIGDNGRYPAEPGTVIVHTPFDRHSDEVGTHGATIVNVPLGAAAALQLGSGLLDDVDAFARGLARGEPALALLAAQSVTPLRVETDLPDLLARDLAARPVTEIGGWAERMQVSPRTLSRAFRSAFGMTAAHYRWRCRTRAAWRAVALDDEPLAQIAHDWGFADQAHLSRSIRDLSGRSPGAWRRMRLAD